MAYANWNTAGQNGGTISTPRLIDNEADFAALYQNVAVPGWSDWATGELGIGTNDGYFYKLTANLDLSSTNIGLGAGVFWPLGRTTYEDKPDNWDEKEAPAERFYSQFFLTLKFDGDGHTISNATFAGGDWFDGGLFAELGPTSTVSNLHVDHLTCSSSSSGYSWHYYSGGFVGNNGGTITACSVTSSSSSSSTSGGFVGINSGTITACSVTSSSSSSSSYYYSGGFVGYNNSSTITACFAACTVGSTGTRRGFCGAYYTGTMTYNYWDTDYNTTVNNTETKATGLTTAQCKDADGTIYGLYTGSNLWYFQDGSYPQLTAFGGGGTVNHQTVALAAATSRAITRTNRPVRSRQATVNRSTTRKTTTAKSRTATVVGSLTRKTAHALTHAATVATTTTRHTLKAATRSVSAALSAAAQHLSSATRYTLSLARSATVALTAGRKTSKTATHSAHAAISQAGQHFLAAVVHTIELARAAHAAITATRKTATAKVRAATVATATTRTTRAQRTRAAQSAGSVTRATSVEKLTSAGVSVSAATMRMFHVMLSLAASVAVSAAGRWIALQERFTTSIRGNSKATAITGDSDSKAVGFLDGESTCDT